MPLDAVISYVYNLKIAETTRRNFSTTALAHPSVIALTGITNVRTKYNSLKEESGGVLGTYIYARPHWYFKADAAAAHISFKYKGSTESRTQTDDILLSGGYGVTLGPQARVTFSGLVGLPTHNDRSLSLPQFGIGHVGLGAQLDAAVYHDGNRAHHLVQAATRLIHFFPRSTVAMRAQNSVRLDVYPGDLLDLFIGYQISVRMHALEVGYNPSFLFNVKTSSVLPGISFDHVYIRPSFYANYRYLFKAYDVPMGFGIGASYGFDIKQSPLNNRRSTTVWTGLGMLF